MPFNSLEFFVFFFAAISLHWALPSRFRNLFLLGASYVFYAAWDWRFLGLILLSTGVDYFCAIEIGSAKENPRRRRFLWASLSANLLLLGTFKYFDFFSRSLSDLAVQFGIQADPFLLNVALPIGISFYTFQTMAYTVDVYRGKIAPERDPWIYALFVAFFPQLVSGPIERAADLLPQLKRHRVFRWNDAVEGARCVLYALFLKFFVADNLAPTVDAIFARSGSLSTFDAWLGGYAFFVQVFADFAGYSLIAIGTAAFLGVRLSTNFKQPFFSENPSHHWAQWHITLSAWFRDYVFYPLGGDRKGGWVAARNLLITMALVGLWHGAAWNFVLWGLFHALLSIAHRALRSRIPEGWTRLKVLFMFQLLALSVIPFRAESASQIGEFFLAALPGGPWASAHSSYWAFQFLFHAAPCFVLQILERRFGNLRELPTRFQVPLWLMVYLLIALYGQFGSKEFIYFQF